MNKTRKTDLQRFTRRISMTGLVLVASLAGCVPIRFAQRYYQPNKADVTVERGHRSGCAFNENSDWGLQRVGGVEFKSRLYTRDLEGASPRAILSLSVSERNANGRLSKVSLSASQIRLEEGGRVLRGRLDDTRTFDIGTSLVVAFPSPSGVEDNVRIVFSPNTVRLDGKPITLKPIRFSLDESPVIYMFPCIPS